MACPRKIPDGTNPGGTARGGPQAGLSLVELLVSITILAVAATIALVLYDGARQSFKVGENLSEQQQAVRIAYDLVTSDLRQAGFNTNPDGSESRPDEQIEATLDTAIVIRADFDVDDPVASRDPEDTLGGPGSAFLTVSTGNDEIRTYVLAKPDGSSGDTLTFEADVGQTVRDGTVEIVNIDGVALTHDDPPYTLYRVTLDEDGSPQRTVLIENVRSMRFRYLDRAGNPLAAAGGMDTPAAVQARAAVRRVGFDLEALTRDPDLHWSDASDPDPRTRSFRKFRLAGDVSPRNLGLRGIKDFQSDTVPPSPPAAPQLFPGHCGGLYVAWAANPPADEASYYRLRFGTDPGNLDGQRVVEQTGYYLGGLLDGVQYYVALQAIDTAGNQSALGPIAGAKTENTNVPETPDCMKVDDRPGGIEVGWDPVTENASLTVGDPYSPQVRDLAGYRVYRATDEDFVPGQSTLIADESLLSVTLDPELFDDRAIGCRRYYYRVTAVDLCGAESAPTTAREGVCETSIPPLPPEGVEAFVGSPSRLKRVQWVDVREDVNGDPVSIDKYKIFRTSIRPAGLPPPEPGDYCLRAVVEGANVWEESLEVDPDEEIWYVVTAVDDCINESEFSEPAVPDCIFVGRVVVKEPAYGSEIWGPTTLRIVVKDGSGDYDEVRIRGYHESTLEDWESSVDEAGMDWSVVWDAQPAAGYPEGWYRIEVEVDHQDGTGFCTASTWTRVHVTPPWE